MVSVLRKVDFFSSELLLLKLKIKKHLNRSLQKTPRASKTKPVDEKAFNLPNKESAITISFASDKTARQPTSQPGGSSELASKEVLEPRAERPNHASHYISPRQNRHSRSNTPQKPTKIRR